MTRYRPYRAALVSTIPLALSIFLQIYSAKKNISLSQKIIAFSS